MKTDAEVIATRDDVEMIERPHLWPSYPSLPLKRRAPDPAGSLVDYGFLEDNPEHPYRVYIGLMFLPDGTNYKDYPSGQAIVADGWVVD